MGQEHAHRDGGIGIIGIAQLKAQVGTGFAVQLQLALAHQLHDAVAGKLLADAGAPETGIRRYRLVPGRVAADLAAAGKLAVHFLAVLINHHAQPRHLGTAVAYHGVKLFIQGRLGLRTQGCRLSRRRLYLRIAAAQQRQAHTQPGQNFFSM